MKSYKYLSVSSISYTNPIVVTKVINGYVTTTVSLFVKTSDFESMWIFTKISFKPTFDMKSLKWYSMANRHIMHI